MFVIFSLIIFSNDYYFKAHEKKCDESPKTRTNNFFKGINKKIIIYNYIISNLHTHLMVTVNCRDNLSQKLSSPYTTLHDTKRRVVVTKYDSRPIYILATSAELTILGI